MGRLPGLTGRRPRQAHAALAAVAVLAAAAAALQRLGLVNATDLDGGFAAWAAAGLPVTPAGSG